MRSYSGAGLQAFSLTVHPGPTLELEVGTLFERVGEGGETGRG